MTTQKTKQLAGATVVTQHNVERILCEVALSIAQRRYIELSNAVRPRNVKPSTWDAQWARDMAQATAALTDAELTQIVAGR